LLFSNRLFLLWRTVSGFGFCHAGLDAFLNERPGRYPAFFQFGFAVARIVSLLHHAGMNDRIADGLTASFEHFGIGLSLGCACQADDAQEGKKNAASHMNRPDKFKK
jgi:hypothetical protein